MRATQVTPTQIVQTDRYSTLLRHSFMPNWVARTPRAMTRRVRVAVDVDPVSFF